MLKTLIASLVLATASVLPAVAQSSPPCFITGNDVNIRPYPSVTSDLITQWDNRHYFEGTDTVFANGRLWVELLVSPINGNGWRVGYVSAAYVNPSCVRSLNGL